MKTRCCQLIFALLLVPDFSISAGAQINSAQMPGVVIGPNTTQTRKAGNGSGRFFSPSGVAIDPATRKVFVSDSGNHRVLRFPAIALEESGWRAEAVLGQPGFATTNSGTALSQMQGPAQMTFSPEGHLYVADLRNNRVLRFDNPRRSNYLVHADAVLGQDSFTNRFSGLAPNRMEAPTGLVFDHGGGLYVNDTGNARILWFANAATRVNGAAADRVIGQISFTSRFTAGTSAHTVGGGIAVLDSLGRLYVSDHDKNRILRFDDPARQATGLAADFVIGQTNFTDRGRHRLLGPMGMAALGSNVLLVVDRSYNRVIRFDPANSTSFDPAPVGVLGSIDPFTDGGLALHLAASQPGDVALDPTTGKVFVADVAARRILRYPPAAIRQNDVPPEAVLGQSDLLAAANAEGRNHFPTVSAIAFSPSGALFVCDHANHRVMRFDQASSLTNGAPADAVFGQADFNTDTSGTNLAKFDTPRGIAVSPAGSLFVADTANQRVLRFDNAELAESGGAANAVFGAPADVRQAMSFPDGVAVDTSGRLWVSDQAMRRVLRFDDAGSSGNFPPADGVLGQAGFGPGFSPATNRFSFQATGALAITTTGRLYVADRHRILWFDDAAGKTNGAPADGWLGQPSFDENRPGTSRGRFGLIGRLATTGDGDLLVADLHNHRVPIFSANGGIQVSLDSVLLANGNLQLTLDVTHPENWKLQHRREAGNGSWRDLSIAPNGNQWTIPRVDHGPRQLYRAVRLP